MLAVINVENWLLIMETWTCWSVYCYGKIFNNNKISEKF